jgi:hypothetical protein
MKTARNITGFIMVFGIVLILGAVGTSDYMTEIGQYYPLSETLKMVGVGVLLMLPYWIIKVIDDNFEIHIRINGKDF